jgi:hypothetical protein
VHRAQLPYKISLKLWAKAAFMANEAENMLMKVGKNSLPHNEVSGFESKNIWNLCRFGEAGIAKKGLAIQSKKANPGIAVMYLGHASKHGQEVYCLLNIETKHVSTKRRT